MTRQCNAHRCCTQGRRVVGAVAHHQYATSTFLQCTNAVDLVLGGEIAGKGLDPDGTRDLRHVLGFVARQQLRIANAKLVERCKEWGEISAEFVREFDTSNRPRRRPDVGAQPIGIGIERRDARRECWHRFAHVVRRPHCNNNAVHRSAYAAPGFFNKRGCHNAHVMILSCCGIHDHSREQMSRSLLDGGGERQQLGRGRPVARVLIGDDPAHAGLADRQRPRLVEDRGRDAGECLERTTVAHDDGPSGCAIDPANDRHGRGENQWARRGDDEHRKHARPIVGHQPCCRAGGDREGSEPDGPLVRCALQRTFGCLRAAHQFNDLCVLTFLRRANGVDRQRAFLIRTA